MESTHYGELTARQTGMVRALIQDQIDRETNETIIKELKEILDIFGGPSGSEQH
jgi:predicted SpoU family rRNA methylase